MAFWACVLLVSLAGRLATVDLLTGRVVGGDYAIYVALAKNLLAGHGYVVNDPNILPNMRATYPPGYPILLAGFGVIAPLAYATIAAFSTIIDGACARLMYKLGAKAASKPVGSAAAAIYLIWPAKLAAAPVAHKESLVALLVVGLAFILLRALERPRTRLAILYGGVTGLLLLTQPALAPLPAIFVLLAIRRFEPGRRTQFVGLALVGTAAVLLPWWIRNWVAFGQFVPLTSAGGYGLWVGATPQGDGTWMRPPQAFLRGDEFELSRALGQEAWRIILSDPAGFVAHCFGKLARAFAQEGVATDVLYNALPQPASATLSKGWRFVATGFYFAALLGGIAQAIRRPKHILSLLLIAGFLQVLLFGMWLEFGERHRQFLTPLLLLCAGAFVAQRIATPRSAGQSVQPVRGTARG